MAQLTGKLTLAQRKAIAEALEIGWYHIGHHRECNPRPDGCECDADELKWRLGKFSSAQFIASKAAFIHEGTLDLLRALPPFVGHSWRCQGLTCHGCHYPRLVELGAEFGIVFEPRSWSAWWCDKCDKFFHSRPAAHDGSCASGEECLAYRSIVREFDVRDVPF
jgi:hypothetical protein